MTQEVAQVILFFIAIVVLLFGSLILSDMKAKRMHWYILYVFTAMMGLPFFFHIFILAIAG